MERSLWLVPRSHNGAWDVVAEGGGGGEGEGGVLGRASAESSMSMCSAFHDREPLTAPSAHDPDSVPSPAKVVSRQHGMGRGTYVWLLGGGEREWCGGQLLPNHGRRHDWQASVPSCAHDWAHTKPTSTAFPCPTRLPTTSHWSSVQDMVMCILFVRTEKG